jgi:hypothetical protein
MNKRKLQSLINASVKANNAKHKAERALNKFCEEEFGFAPSDNDCDYIIDSVFGGCGYSMGMSAEEFISHMEASK